MFKSLGLLKEETNQDGSTNQEAVEYNQKLIDNAVGLLYGDNYYTEHPVPTQGILFKMNVKTGESKIIMAGSVNGYQVTLRNAVAYNGRFYFIGTQVGTERSTLRTIPSVPSIRRWTWTSTALCSKPMFFPFPARSLCIRAL